MLTPKTPFEIEFGHRLESQVSQFCNNWLFPWHNINITGTTVDVEDFFGGRFHTGGIRFEGQVQQLYWRSVEKYITDAVIEHFRDWHRSTEKYSNVSKHQSLARTTGLINAFASRVLKEANSTDRRLRGRGFPDEAGHLQ